MRQDPEDDEVKTMQHTITELETALQKRIKEMKLPGVSVCIRGPEGVIYEKGFGKRSIEQDLDVTPETVFGIASMSKSFTALSCCILAAEGKMSLEDPITKYFPTLNWSPSGRSVCTAPAYRPWNPWNGPSP